MRRHPGSAPRLACAVAQFLALAFPVSALATGTVEVEPNQRSTVEPILTKAKEGGGFLEGSSLVLKPRTYYLNRDRDRKPDNEGWALGGALAYQSGWWLDHLRVAATVYTSQKLYGPEEKDGTLLFKPGPESFTVLGEANVTARIVDNHGIRIGRQRFEIPYLGSHDIRMVPNTFEAVAVGNSAPTGLAYLAGYVDRIKRKNDDEFIPMSQAAGAAGSDEGVAFAGARYATKEGTLFGAVYQHSFETFNTLFAKIEHPFSLGQDTTLKAFLQYTDQRSTGDALIGSFDTSLIAGKLELKRGATTWRVGASRTDDGFGIQKPYGNPANYLSVIVDDFDRAGEKAWMLGMSHDFKRTGVGDLSLFANVVHGDTPDSGPNASADETEYDLTFDYRIKEGAARNLWIRVRGAYIDQDEKVAGGDDFFDFRIILNYDLDLL